MPEMLVKVSWEEVKETLIKESLNLLKSGLEK